MSGKTKLTLEEKEQAVIAYLEGNKSRAQICDELCISSRSIQDWALIYNRQIFHSNRGFQYTSKAFRKKLEKQEMEQSTSRAGHCIGNESAEVFGGIIKSEM